MRILFFIDSLGVGGVLRQLSLLAEGLRKRGHVVSVAALYPVDTEWTEMWESSQIPVRVFYASRPLHVIPEAFGLARAMFEIRRMIKNERIQILYAFQGHTARLISWLAVISSHGTKIVWGMRGGSSGVRSEGYRRRESPSLYVNKWVSRFIPLMISNSEAGLRSRRNLGYIPKKELVINNGIDTEKFKPAPGARSAVRFEWGIPESSPLVGIAARLSPVKGHREFITAASLIIKERPDVRFVCIGDGDLQYASEIRILSRKLELENHLIWAGNRADMPSVLNALDVLCSSSYSEGFSNVIAEAMACGVPCVVTDVGDSALILGEFGIVVPPSDPAGLAEGLVRILNMLGHIRPEELRDRIKNNFTVESVVLKTEMALEDLLS